MRKKEEIEQCIKAVKARLKEPLIDTPLNKYVKEGYIKALEILNKKICNYENAGIKSLGGAQSKAIAILTVDYLNEECEMSVLISISAWVL